MLATDLAAPRRLCCQAPLLPVYTSLSPVTELFLTFRTENIIRKHELLKLNTFSGFSLSTNFVLQSNEFSYLL